VQQLNSASSVELLPYHEAYAPGFQDMLRRKPVVDKLIQFTGFKPETPLREIIRQTSATQ
jgi:UDP-glucose 4-epimerase